MTETAAPMVSICMPVHNGENFIADAIASILGQTFSDLELIVTDNASTDRTQGIVRDFAGRDARVRYVRNEKNIGAAANYNLGFDLSRGRYVKWAAHDDTLSANFLERTVAILDADPSVSIAFGRTQCIDGEGAELPMQGYPMPEIRDDAAKRRFARALRGGGSCFPIFGLFRSEQLSRSSLHRKSYYGSDRALIVEMLVLGKLRFDEEAIFFNRIHPKQSVSLKDRCERGRWQGSSAGRFSSLERTNFLLHVWEIAGRHPDVVPKPALRREALAFVLRPIELARLLIEGVQFVSPAAAAQIRPIAKLVWNSLPGSGRPRGAPTRQS